MIASNLLKIMREVQLQNVDLTINAIKKNPNRKASQYSDTIVTCIVYGGHMELGG